MAGSEGESWSSQAGLQELSTLSETGQHHRSMKQMPASPTYRRRSSSSNPTLRPESPRLRPASPSLPPIHSRGKRHSFDAGYSQTSPTGSPPFSALSPLQLARPPSHGRAPHTSSRFWEERSNNIHNGIRDLLYQNNHFGAKAPDSPRSNSPSPQPPDSPTSVSHALPPVGALAAANALLSPPHALLRQASLASLAPPELSLGEVDAKWPEPADMSQTQRIPSELHTPTSPEGMPTTSSDEHHALDNSMLFPPIPPTSTSPSSPSSIQAVSSPRNQNQNQNHNQNRPVHTRRRKRSSRSSMSSGGSNSSSTSSTGARSIGSSMQEDEEPASPPPPPRTKQPHLAMPERSGWEYTDEDEDEDFSPPDEDSDQDSPNEHPLPDDKPNNSSLLLQHFPPERDHRSASVPTPTAEAGDIDFLPEQLQYTDIDKPPPPPTFDADTLPPPGHHFPTLPGAEFSDDEDESLSVLERIFILSKSEYREHRLSVTRALPEWLSEVDICEAAEYVLPLLNGLASDEDEVKVGLAQGLDRLMFYFFSRCPLAEQNSNSASSASLGAPRHRSRELSSLHRRQDSATSQISELAQPMELDDEDKAAMSSIVEEHSDEVIDPPEISVGAFTPILGLLLMEPNIEVSSWARAAVVRFLCRINEKEIPAAFQDESANVPASPTRRLQERRSSIDVDEPQIGGAAPRAHRHTTYTLTDAARKALEQQILVDVVLGLARLESADEDDSDDDGDTMSQAEERYRQSRESECEDVEFADGTRTPTAARPFAPASPPSWDMRSESPTVEQEEYVSTGPSRTLDQEDEGWASVDRNGGSPSGPSSASPDWGMPLRSFQPAPAAPTSLSSSASMSHGGNFYGMSAFDGDTEVEDEATQGKIASLELVSAIALSQCLPEQQVADAFLPEVKKMVDDPAPRVRSIAASALGPLAKALPAELVSSLLVSLMESFSSDPLPTVRRWACLTLPDIFGRLSPDVRHDKVVEATAHFSQDASRDVRSALTEICGPLIHLFKSEENEQDATVPQEILNWYLGKPAGDDPAAYLPSAQQPAFVPLPTALSAFGGPPQSSSQPGHQRLPSFTQLGHPTDPERAMICAYNLPAVALTLGSKRWHLLLDFYLALTQAKQTGIRRSLAASLHAIVDIIGPEKSARDLVPVAKAFLLEDEAREVREMVLEHFIELVLGLPLQAGEDCLEAVHTAVTSQSPPNLISWRAREKTAGQMSALAAHFVGSQLPIKLPTTFLELLHNLLKDEVASVRAASVRAVPAVFEAILQQQNGRDEGSSMLVTFLCDSFAYNESYRHRCTFVTCVSALLLETDASQVFKMFFLEHSLQALGTLARDPVVNVRMALARLVHVLITEESLFNIPSSRPKSLNDIRSQLRQDPDSTVRELLGSPVEDKILSSQTTPQAVEDSAKQIGKVSELLPLQPSNSASSGNSDSAGSFAGDLSNISDQGSNGRSRESTPGDDSEDYGLSSSTITDLTALSREQLNDIDDVLAGATLERQQANGHYSPPEPVSQLRKSGVEHAISFNSLRPGLTRKLSQPTSSGMINHSNTITPPLLRSFRSDTQVPHWSPPDEDFVQVES